jgi:hypothetical protein
MIAPSAWSADIMANLFRKEKSSAARLNQPALVDRRADE